MALSERTLIELEHEYRGQPPPCRVCGAPMTFASSDRGVSTYTCSSDAASPVKNDIFDQVSREHYQASRWWTSQGQDPRVILAVAEIRELREKTAELTGRLAMNPGQ
jgi:hypothetical protein